MTTPTTLDTRSRWVAPASFAVLGALGATILGACQPSTGLDMSKPMSDGTWTAQSNPDDQGSIGTITITVEGGRITATSYATSCVFTHNILMPYSLIALNALNSEHRTDNGRNTVGTTLCSNAFTVVFLIYKRAWQVCYIRPTL